MQLLSNNLKHLRTSCQLTQYQISTALRVNRNTYDAWENRGIEPSIEKLIALSDFYGITVDELLKCEDIKQQEMTLENKFLVASDKIQRIVNELLEL